MARGGSRAERVAEQIRMEMGEILQRQLKDPRVGLATCTRVQVTGDLKLARIYISVLADPDGQNKAMQALERAAGFVRRLLGGRLGLRSSPEVQFVFDRSVEYGIELERLIEEAKRQPGAGPSALPAGDEESQEP